MRDPDGNWIASLRWPAGTAEALRPGADQTARRLGQARASGCRLAKCPSNAGIPLHQRRLAERSSAAIIATDDFYRVLDPHVRDRLHARSGLAQYYDWQRLREVLVTVRAGHAVTFHPYDWDRNQLSDHAVTVGPSRIVIVEGLFAARPELGDLIDVSLLVETSPSVRAARQYARADASGEWLTRWDAAERLYLEHVRLPESFDFVVSDG